MNEFISYPVPSPRTFLEQKGSGISRDKTIKRVGTPEPFIPAPEVQPTNRPAKVNKKTRVRSEAKHSQAKRWIDF